MPSTEPVNLPRAAAHKAILRSAARQEPNSIAKLVDSIEQDYQFKLGYLVIESLAKSAPVTIEVERIPESVDPSRVDALTGNLREAWTQALPSAMRSFAYGRAAFEKTYRFDATTGLYFVADLDYLPPEYTELVLDDEGSFSGIKLQVGDDSVLLDPPRSWWFALDPTATEPHGRSRYLGAPLDVWKARRQLDEQERIWYSKFAIGHGIARAPDRMESAPPYQAGSTSTSSSGETNDPMEVLRRELTAIESGGILILSSRTYPDGTPLYDYTESEGQRDSGPLEERRQMLDVAALRSLGIPERAITQNDKSGSRAMAQVHLEVLYRTCEGILDQLIASFQQYVIRKVIEINWPDGKRPVLRMRYRPIGDVSTTTEEDANAVLARKLVGEQDLPALANSPLVDVTRLLASAGIPQPINPIGMIEPSHSAPPVSQANSIPFQRTNGHSPRVFPRQSTN